MLLHKYQVTPCLLKFLSIWSDLPTAPHCATVCCIFCCRLVRLHIYSELSQEFYFIYCTVLYLYCNAHIYHVIKQQTNKNKERPTQKKQNKNSKMNMHASCSSSSQFTEQMKKLRRKRLCSGLVSIPKTLVAL